MRLQRFQDLLSEVKKLLNSYSNDDFKQALSLLEIYKPKGEEELRYATYKGDALRKLKRDTEALEAYAQNRYWMTSVQIRISLSICLDRLKLPTELSQDEVVFNLATNFLRLEKVEQAIQVLNYQYLGSLKEKISYPR